MALSLSIGSHHAGSLGYYDQLVTLSHALGVQSGNHHTLLAGMGTIGYEPEVSTFFGIPRAITVGGIAFDIPIINASASNDGDKEKTKRFTYQTGLISSALEHSTPEQIFATDNPSQPPTNAISAVKAMQIANESGQRIYQITKDNMAATLPNIHHSSATMDEIRAALNAGKEVTTHTDAVSVPGWTGAGYITLSETGDGAYKISGGANGGFLGGVMLGSAISLAIASLVLFPNPASLAILLGLVAAAIATYFLYAALYDDDTAKCFITGIEMALLSIGIILGALGLAIKGPIGTRSGLIGLALEAIDGLLLYGVDGNTVTSCTSQ